MEQTPEIKTKTSIDNNGNEVKEEENNLWKYRGVFNPKSHGLIEEQIFRKVDGHLFRTVYNETNVPTEQTEEDKDGTVLDRTKFIYDRNGAFKEVRRFNQRDELIGFDDLQGENTVLTEHPLWKAIQEAIKRGILQSNGPVEGIDALAYAKTKQILEDDFFQSAVEKQ